MIDKLRPFTEKERVLIYENYGTKGAEWCAIKLKRRLIPVQMYAARQRRAILDGRSDEIYLRYVAPKKPKHNIRRSWPYE